MLVKRFVEREVEEGRGEEIDILVKIFSKRKVGKVGRIKRDKRVKNGAKREVCYGRRKVAH